MNIIDKFLQAEINEEELSQAIIDFINSYEIRKGEFEGNEYVIKKIDHLNFLIFPEYEIDGRVEIPFSTSIYKDELLKFIKEHAVSKNLEIEE